MHRIRETKKMKDNNNFSGEFLKGQRKGFENCGFNIPIPRKILNSCKLECPNCGAIYRILIFKNEFKFIKLQKDNK